MHRDGPLQIMVSTGGNGPRLARIVRQGIVKNLPKDIGGVIGKVGRLRRGLRKVAPGAEEGGKRMKWWVLWSVFPSSSSLFVVLVLGFGLDLLWVSFAGVVRYEMGVLCW